VPDEPTSGLDPIAQDTFHQLVREHPAAGGAVLLSSHELAEVQQVAGRIAVLRAGELVAVERLAEMRANSLRHIRAEFAEDVPVAAFHGVPQLRDVVLRGNILTRYASQPSLDALIKVVAQYDVFDFACAEAGLEETFLTYHGRGGGVAGAPWHRAQNPRRPASEPHSLGAEHRCARAHVSLVLAVDA
jgi:ABC-2 type transport system ATP-binding protein